ncbi:MAG TPA: DUF5683 domain-containing protein [Longimicrobiales bacterium]
MKHRLFVAVLLLLATFAGTRAQAQNPVLRPDTMPLADTIPTELPSPRGAFVRAMLVPGWGHLYIREYVRGTVYFSLQSTSWFMLVKTLGKLGEVKDRDSRLTRLAVDSVEQAMAADTALARMLTEDPVAYENALLTYPGLQRTRALVASRKQQRQDWITYTLFFTFAAAVDAYVSAHLKEFPGEITTEPAQDGGFSIGVHVPVGGRH